MKINNSPPFTAFTAKKCQKYAVNIIFFTALHRISYENSPRNLDQGNNFLMVPGEFLCNEFRNSKESFGGNLVGILIFDLQRFLIGSYIILILYNSPQNTFALTSGIISSSACKQFVYLKYC